MCDLGAALMMGPPQIDGTYRFHARGEDVGQMCLLGTFSEYTVVPKASLVKIDQGDTAGQGGVDRVWCDDRVRVGGAHR